MNGLNEAINERKSMKVNKLDCTEKAWEIMLKHTTWRKPKKLTSKRQAYIDEAWPRWKIYRDALKKAGMYKGCEWSGDKKYPRVDIDTKEKFTTNLLTHHSMSHKFIIEIR